MNLMYSNSNIYRLYLASRLNEYIHHYEPLDYHTDEIHEHHIRVRRWTEGKVAGVEEEPEVHLTFTAHKTNFKLRLKRDTSTFSSSLYVDGDGVENNAVDTSHIYSGHLEGEKNVFLGFSG